MQFVISYIKQSNDFKKSCGKVFNFINCVEFLSQHIPLFIVEVCVMSLTGVPINVSKKDNSLLWKFLTPIRKA